MHAHGAHGASDRSGTTLADVTAWALTYVLVEGKMRGLFAALFGASMLLVIDRADARGGNGAALHLHRMATLFVIGCAHLYFVWSGDILSLYALVGCVALLFSAAPPPWFTSATRQSAPSL